MTAEWLTPGQRSSLTNSKKLHYLVYEFAPGYENPADARRCSIASIFQPSSLKCERSVTFLKLSARLRETAFWIATLRAIFGMLS